MFLFPRGIPIFSLSFFTFFPLPTQLAPSLHATISVNDLKSIFTTPGRQNKDEMKAQRDRGSAVRRFPSRMLAEEAGL